jgi:hypothetical protein
MKRRHASILMGVVGVLIFLVVVIVGGGAWFFASAFESIPANEASATASFDQVRQRFAGVVPVFALEASETVAVQREPLPEGAARPVARLLLRHWDPDDDELVEVTLPFWLVRLNPGEFSVTADQHGLRGVTAAQLERYGPTLLVDHSGRGGDRLLIWTE